MEAGWVESARQNALADLSQAVQESARAQARGTALRAVVEALEAVGSDPMERVRATEEASGQQEPGGELVILPGPGSANGSRSERIRALLDAAPARRWKARDIANAIGVQNVRSLRGTLQTMVERVEIERDTDAWYQSARDAAPARPPGKQAAM
jgi:hypothetical protein